MNTITMSLFKFGVTSMKKIIYATLSLMVLHAHHNTHVKARAILSRQLPYAIEIIAENLYVPWAIAISDHGKLYFTERSGTIKTIENGKLNPQPLITFSPPFISQGEGGLMGIALDPNHSQNHYIYVMYSYAEGNQIYNRVVRLIENNNTASIDRILIDRIPGGRFHNGGRLKIGPDGKLYVTTGDAGNPSLAQDPLSLAGKILRIERDGTIPSDNPLPDSLVYSLGHRNPQGLAWNSENVMYASEHGPSAHDEINIIVPGGNYGWPLVQGNDISEEFMSHPPLIDSGDETWAPSGMTFLDQGPWQNRLLIATLLGQQLLALSLDSTGRMINNVESYLSSDYGRLREVIQAKDGAIYLATSNRDGRGTPNTTDDKIIRLIPK